MIHAFPQSRGLFCGSNSRMTGFYNSGITKIPPAPPKTRMPIIIVLHHGTSNIDPISRIPKKIMDKLNCIGLQYITYNIDAHHSIRTIAKNILSNIVATEMYLIVCIVHIFDSVLNCDIFGNNEFSTDSKFPFLLPMGYFSSVNYARLCAMLISCECTFEIPHMCIVNNEIHRISNSIKYIIQSETPFYFISNGPMDDSISLSNKDVIAIKDISNSQYYMTKRSEYDSHYFVKSTNDGNALSAGSIHRGDQPTQRNPKNLHTQYALTKFHFKSTTEALAIYKIDLKGRDYVDVCILQAGSIADQKYNLPFMIVTFRENYVQIANYRNLVSKDDSSLYQTCELRHEVINLEEFIVIIYVCPKFVSVVGTSVNDDQRLFQFCMPYQHMNFDAFNYVTNQIMFKFGEPENEGSSEYDGAIRMQKVFMHANANSEYNSMSPTLDPTSFMGLENWDHKKVGAIWRARITPTNSRFDKKMSKLNRSHSYFMDEESPYGGSPYHSGAIAKTNITLHDPISRNGLYTVNDFVTQYDTELYNAITSYNNRSINQDPDAFHHALRACNILTGKEMCMFLRHQIAGITFESDAVQINGMRLQCSRDENRTALLIGKCANFCEDGHTMGESAYAGVLFEAKYIYQESSIYLIATIMPNMEAFVLGKYPIIATADTIDGMLACTQFVFMFYNKDLMIMCDTDAGMTIKNLLCPSSNVECVLENFIDNINHAGCGHTLVYGTMFLPPRENDIRVVAPTVFTTATPKDCCIMLYKNTICISSVRRPAQSTKFAEACSNVISQSEMEDRCINIAPIIKY